jgi:hypothetical protein
MLEFSLLSDFLFTTLEISVYTKQKFTLNKRKVRLQEIKKLNFSKFNLIITEVQLNIPSSSAACEKQFKYSVFFRADILPIKIVSICPSCTSKPHKYLIYNDMSLLSLVHSVMPPINHHSHAKFKSLTYGRRFYCLLFLKIISKSCKISNHHLDKKVVQFKYLSNGISFTSFRLVV